MDIEIESALLSKADDLLSIRIDPSPFYPSVLSFINWSTTSTRKDSNFVTNLCTFLSNSVSDRVVLFWFFRFQLFLRSWDQYVMIGAKQNTSLHLARRPTILFTYPLPFYRSLLQYMTDSFFYDKTNQHEACNRNGTSNKSAVKRTTITHHFFWISNPVKVANR